MTDLSNHSAAELLEAAGFNVEGITFDMAVTQVAELQRSAMEMDRIQGQSSQAQQQVVAALAENQRLQATVDALDAQLSDEGLTPVTHQETWGRPPETEG